MIVPDTIVIDHGSVFVSDNFRSSCRHLGISIQPAHLATGSDKPHIEKMFSTLGTLFCQFAAGYLGRSADRRGRHVEEQPLWSLMQMQDLLDEWLISVWQNRAHEGLRDPLHPQRTFSPNQKYAALIETAGYVPVPLSAEDHIELLPATWRAVNAYGIKISHRTYDAAELNPIRQQKSGVAPARGCGKSAATRTTCAGVRPRPRASDGSPARGNTWAGPTPVRRLAWDHATGRPGRGGPKSTPPSWRPLRPSPRCWAGPIMGRRDTDRRRRPGPARRRVARPHPRRRPNACATAADNRAAADPVPARLGCAEPRGKTKTASRIAKIIPLGVFDPFKEADKRW